MNGVRSGFQKRMSRVQLEVDCAQEERIQIQETQDNYVEYTRSSLELLSIPIDESYESQRRVRITSHTRKGSSHVKK